jgi:hypothetical protein
MKSCFHALSPQHELIDLNLKLAKCLTGKESMEKDMEEDKFGKKSKKGEKGKGDGGRKSLWVSITLSLAPSFWFFIWPISAYLQCLAPGDKRMLKSLWLIELLQALPPVGLYLYIYFTNIYCIVDSGSTGDQETVFRKRHWP